MSKIIKIVEIYLVLVGLLEAVGDQIYNVKVTPEVLEINKLKTGLVKEHVIFLLHIHEEDGTKQLAVENIASNEPGSLRMKVSVVNPLKTSRKVSTLSSQMLIDVDTFCDIFPYHVLFDSSLRILQSGYKLQILSGKSWLSLNLKLSEIELERRKVSSAILRKRAFP